MSIAQQVLAAQKLRRSGLVVEAFLCQSKGTPEAGLIDTQGQALAIIDGDDGNRAAEPFAQLFIAIDIDSLQHERKFVTQGFQIGARGVAQTTAAPRI